MELILAATLSCADGKWILDGIAQSDISNTTRSELIITVIQDMPDDCEHEDYVPGSRQAS